MYLQNKEIMEQNNIVLFQSQDGQTRLEVKQAGESVWFRQEQIAELLRKDVSGVSRHIDKIFKDGELDEEGGVSKVTDTPPSLVPSANCGEGWF